MDNQESQFRPASDLFGNQVLQRFSKKNASRKTRRGEVYREFMAKMNPGRVTAGFKPFTESRMGYLLQGIKDEDLEDFYRACDKAKSFGGFFTWSLKPKERPAEKRADP